MKHDKAKNKNTNKVILAREVENEAIDCDCDVKSTQVVLEVRNSTTHATNGKTLAFQRVVSVYQLQSQRTLIEYLLTSSLQEIVNIFPIAPLPSLFIFSYEFLLIKFCSIQTLFPCNALLHVEIAAARAVKPHKGMLLTILSQVCMLFICSSFFLLMT